MLLRIRYEDNYQTVELDEAATDQLWVSFSLEGDDLSQEEKEAKIQEAWEDAYNKPEYNIWHKETRHLDKTFRKKDKYGADREADIEEKIMERAKNKDTFNRDENDRQYKDSYEHTCDQVRRILTKKPDWADMVIAVRLDGESIRDYAKRNGISENNVTQKLKRAAKKLRKNWERNSMDWIISIENCAVAIAEELGWTVVKSVLNRYGANTIEELNPADYSDVFSELSAIEADMK